MHDRLAPMLHILGPVHGQFDALDDAIIVLGFGSTLGSLSGCELNESTLLPWHDFDSSHFSVVVKHISQVSFGYSVSQTADPQSGDALVFRSL